MAKSKVKNGAKGTVSTGYDASATSIVLTTGHGASFPSSGNFYLAWWNVTDYPDPTDDPNYELIQVTARSTDTLTIVRGRDGTSASTKNASGKTYKVMLPVTAALLDELLENVLTTRGDLVVQGSSVPQRLGLGPRGAAMMSDGTDPRWIGPQNCVWVWDDFLTETSVGQTGWGGGNANSGSTPTARSGDADRPGVLSFETAASSTGVSFVRKAVTAGLVKLGGGLIEMGFAFKFATALSDGSESYVFRIGLGDNSTAQPTNGVYIETSTSGVISGVSRKASTDTAAGSTVSGVNNTWYDVRIVIDATASQAEFFVDGVSLGTVGSSNLPTAGLGLFAHAIKSAGTTDRRVHLDYFCFYKELTNARS